MIEQRTTGWVWVLALSLALAGCSEEAGDENGGSSGSGAGAGGASGNAGSAGSGGMSMSDGGSAAQSGSAGASNAGAGGSSGSAGVSAGGGAVGGTMATACKRSGCSGQGCVDADAEDIVTTCEWLEEYACYQAAPCEVQANGSCGHTPSPELTACLADADVICPPCVPPPDSSCVGTGPCGCGPYECPLSWRATCGAAICGVTQDDTEVPNCVSEAEREPCTERDARCETLECAVELVCTDTDPTNGGQCPESRARVKRDIEYVSDADRRALHDAVVHLPLASYRYKIDPEGASHLGFIIDDIEPSPAARGDRVDLYGYLSMAVAAIQVQQQELDRLRSELQALRDQSTAVCE